MVELSGTDETVSGPLGSPAQAIDVSSSQSHVVPLLGKLFIAVLVILTIAMVALRIRVRRRRRRRRMRSRLPRR
jgi:hypothetical protein